MAERVHYLSDEETLRLACELVKVLQGVPIVQAWHILEDAKSLVMDTQVVDTGSLRFRAKLAELGFASPG